MPLWGLGDLEELHFIYMATFDKDRLVNFARYDLTINKTFYRNITIATIACMLGITVLGFTIRYGMYTPQDELGEWRSYQSYNDCTGTVAMLIGFAGIMYAIFAGCWAHNLVTKQGRITELTLPATNAEKFAWHISLMQGAGLLLLLLSLLICDGINALLTLMVYDTSQEGVASMFRIFGDISSALSISSADGVVDDPLPYIIIEIASILATMLTYTIFVFSNAVKYKYNLIITIIALWVLQIVLNIIGWCLAILFSINFEGLYNSDTVAYTIAILCIVVMAALICILWYFTYKKYRNAQVTSKLNK